MFLSGKNKERNGPVKQKKPGSEDYTPGAVNRAVLNECLNHPATIFPLAASAVMLGWALIVAPTPISIALAVGFAFTGATAFIYNYVVQGPGKAQARVALLNKQRLESDFAELVDIRHQCESLGFHEAGKEAGELQRAYENLLNHLIEKNQDTVCRFRIMAHDALKEGIRVLGAALSVHKAMRSINVSNLERELQGWKTQLELAAPDSSAARTLSQQIDDNQRRIALHKERQASLKDLLAQSNAIESALEQTYLELVDMGLKDPSRFLGADSNAATRLTDAVAAARRVEERLQSSEKEAENRRRKYLDAARQAEERHGDPDRPDYHSERPLDL